MAHYKVYVRDSTTGHAIWNPYMTDICDYCGDRHEIICQRCHGSGQVADVQNGTAITFACRQCNGSGTVKIRDCKP